MFTLIIIIIVVSMIVVVIIVFTIAVMLLLFVIAIFTVMDTTVCIIKLVLCFIFSIINCLCPSTLCYDHCC